MEKPTPEQIRAARLAAGLTQVQAGQAVYSALRTWEDWEAGRRGMHPAIWHLFLLRSGPEKDRKKVASGG